MAGAASGTAFRHLRDLFTAGPVAGLEDGHLLARYSRSNDGPAFEALVSRHGPMVLATCRAVLKDEHDVEDAFQATFLVLAKKARSIRGAETLGGWLHRVAYRASVQAGVEARRREKKEAEAAMARPGPNRPEAERVAWLHEEIDRLPATLRLPVVLCDLEGLTYEEAAARLGWTLPKLRHRLADARGRLKGRMASRAALPLAIGTDLAPRALTAIPSALARAAVASATGGTAPAGVKLLAHTLLRGMLVTKLQLISAASLASLALGSAGVLAAGRAQDEPKPAPKPAARTEAKLADQAAPADDLVEVRGIVVGPDNQPVAGATVYAVRPAPVPETTSGPDGRFRLRVPHPEPPFRAMLKRHPQVIAGAPGFGPGLAAPPYPADPAFDLTIRLVEPGPPVEGRVLDLEGRPVAGAQVHPQLYYAEGGSLDPWLAKVKEKEVEGFGGLWGIVLMKGEGEATTGPDGRFRLIDLGRERVAALAITGPTVASSEVAVLLRDGPEVRGLAEDHSSMSPKPLVYHSPRFDVALPPSKPIEGTVVDKDTGRPIAGLTLEARVFDPYSMVNGPVVRATTDAQGRYRVAGLVKASAYRFQIQVGRKQDLPYLAENRKAVAESPGLEPVAFDLALKRGVEVRGRVIDRATGRPASGTVSAYTFADNPNLADYPGFDQGARPGFGKTDDDGRYRLVTLPGRAVLAFRADKDSYRNGLGAEAIAGYDPKWGGFRETLPHSLGPVNYHALVGAEIRPGAEPTTVDLPVESGGMLELAIVDPEGRPIAGLRADGTSPQMGTIKLPPAATTVRLAALEPEKPRRVTVFHDGRMLVGSAWIKGNEAARPTIRLQPWGSVVGRALPIEGKPRQTRSLYTGNNTPGTKLEEVGILPEAETGNLKVGKDGRFRVDGLVPGLKYAGSASDGEVILGDLFKDVVVGPGEVKDLGDLPVMPYKP